MVVTKIYQAYLPSELGDGNKNFVVIAAN